MSQTCTVCRHPKVAEINQALVAGEPPRGLVPRYAPLTKSSIERHKAEHLPQVLVKAKEAEEVRQALNVVEQLKAINSATLSVLREARTMGSHVLQLQAVDRVLKQIELQAKLLGDLDERPQINILISPQWVTVRAVLMDALQPYPTARAEVAQRLLQLESGQAS